MSLLAECKCRYDSGVTRSFAKHLVVLRNAAGLTQETLAEKLGHKRASTVQSWEKGRRIPRPQSFGRLATALGLHVHLLTPAYITPEEVRVIEMLGKVPPGREAEALGAFGSVVERLRHETPQLSAPRTASEATTAKKPTARRRR